MQSPGGSALHSMVMRGLPTSENRVYSQQSEGGSSLYQHAGDAANNYIRKVSANS